MNQDLEIDFQNGVVSGYSVYLAKTISEMKFIDIDNLKDYLRAHLNIFFSEAISEFNSKGIEVRIDKIQRENEKLLIERAEIEEKFTNAISRSRAGSNENQEWINRCRYAFKMRGVEITNNNQEIARLSKIVKQKIKDENIKSANDENRIKYKRFTAEMIKLFGEDKIKAILSTINSETERTN